MSMERIIMHIDVNNAFLSWTAVDLLNKGSKYDIRNSYAVIGGDSEKRSGIVLAKSTPCKKLGIQTADTIYSAKQKCPALRVFPPNFEFYALMSRKLFQLLSHYTPDIEIASIDECYLDYGKVRTLYGDPLAFASMVQKQILDELGFTVNIGIANNKLCAKMASDFSKPYKIHTLYDYEVKEKMYPLKVGELFGIGKKTVPKLEKLGIFTIGDLANCDEAILRKTFKNMALSMIESARGINRDPVVSEASIPKGIGSEITLVRDVISLEDVSPTLLALAENVALRLRKQKKYAHTVVVTVKTANFKRRSHQKKLLNATDSTSEIYKEAKKIFLEMELEEKIRLIGIRLDNLTDFKVYQGNLFEEVKKVEEDTSLDDVVDSIKLKYGVKSIRKASLKEEEEFKNLKDSL
jgi:DNA polymerase-4